MDIALALGRFTVCFLGRCTDNNLQPQALETNFA